MGALTNRQRSYTLNFLKKSKIYPAAYYLFKTLFFFSIALKEEDL